MPNDFRQAFYPVDIWTPLVFGDEQRVPRADAPRDLAVFTRLKPGLAFAQAKAEVQSLDKRYSASVLRAGTGWGASVMSIEDYFVQQSTRTVLALLMGVAGSVLLIVCGNISGLLIARGLSREKEFAIRKALGAVSWRLVRQLMVENLLLSLMGSGFALLVAFAGVRLLRARLDFDSNGAFIADKITMNGGVLAFILAVSVFAALIFGLLPALETSNVHPGSSLQEVDRTRSSGRKRGRLRSVLVVGQISLALILLTCCAVVIKGLYDLDRLHAGFDPEQVITAGLQLSAGTYDSAAKQRAFVDASVQRIANLPGVLFAAATTNVPISLARMVQFSVEGQPIAKPEERSWARYYAISPDYLRVMNIVLLRGRGFISSDNASKPPVALVNEAFVKQFFAKEDVLGKHVTVTLNPSSDQTTANRVGGNRLVVLMLEIFAILALLLVEIGIYGVIAFTVNQRTQEIGIRLALGAHRRRILLMVLKKGIKLTATGLLLGLPLSAAIPHLLQHVFQGHIVVHTVAVLLGVPVFVALVAIVSTYMPALRASRVDPIHALRYE